MSRVYVLAGAVALAVVLVGATVQADDKDVPTISDIMKKAHGKDGLRGSITKSIKEKNWDEAAKTVKEWEMLSTSLEKNKQPKGEAGSWKMKTTTYSKTLKTLEDAIAAKDSKKATGALGKIGSSCAACHKEHRPAKKN
jgi:cytochrome c556